MTSSPMFTPKELAQSWLTLQCQMIPNVKMGIALFGASAKEFLAPTASWPPNMPVAPRLLAAAETVISGRPPEDNHGQSDCSDSDDNHVYAACPLLVKGHPFGVVALQIEPVPEAKKQAVMQLLQWGAAWLDLLLRKQEDGKGGSEAFVLDALASCLGQEGFEATTRVVTSRLARDLSCDRVSLGVAHNKTVHLQSLSHSTNFEARANLVRNIESAMHEALAHGTSITYLQSAPDGDKTGTLAHRELSEQEGAKAISTVVLKGGSTFGAITLERMSGPPFDAATVSRCERLADLLRPILELKQQKERHPVTRLTDDLQALMGRLFGPGRLRLKLAVAMSLGLLMFLALGTGEFRISAPATLEGTVQRAVVAPYDGYIAAVYARAGETVTAGAVLAELDDRDLLLEQRKWSSQQEELDKQYRKALAKLDHSEARILKAQVSQTRAQLELLDEQLTRTRLIAPFDGAVISGDLSRSLGSPVERGQVLFEVAPLEKYRVALEVDERDIADVSVGQHGHVVLSSMPGERIPLVVETVSTASRSDDASNAFRVEARIEDASGRVRPGMQGVGKLVAGEHRLIWIWTRRLVGWVQLWLWSWLP